MIDFFKTSSIKKLIGDYIYEIKVDGIEEPFKRNRNLFIRMLLSDMQKNGEHWDEYTQFNIVNIRGQIQVYLEDRMVNDDELDIILAIFFRFITEMEFNQKDGVFLELERVRNFIIEHHGDFSAMARQHIFYALHRMPFDLFRSRYNSDDIQHFIAAAKAEGSLKNKITEWNNKIEEQTKKVEGLSKILEEQEVAYNFVGLYKGFHNLSRAKRVEAKTALCNTRVFGFLAIMPLVFEAIMLTINSNGAWFDAFRIALIPSFALTFILVYYFRVSLSSYQSIKSQIVQIELRKSLCTFIQNYSTYAEKMKDKESLRKFENVIFSNIMPSEDKIPSTFDGIEQIAKLIESVKK